MKWRQHSFLLPLCDKRLRDGFAVSGVGSFEANRHDWSYWLVCFVCVGSFLCDTVAQWLVLPPRGFNSRPGTFCVEFACSTRVCVCSKTWLSELNLCIGVNLNVRMLVCVYGHVYIGSVTIGLWAESMQFFILFYFSLHGFSVRM